METLGKIALAIWGWFQSSPERAKKRFISMLEKKDLKRAKRIDKVNKVVSDAVAVDFANDGMSDKLNKRDN